MKNSKTKFTHKIDEPFTITKETEKAIQITCVASDNSGRVQKERKYWFPKSAIKRNENEVIVAGWKVSEMCLYNSYCPNFMPVNYNSN